MAVFEELEFPWGLVLEGDVPPTLRNECRARGIHRRRIIVVAYPLVGIGRAMQNRFVLKEVGI